MRMQITPHRLMDAVIEITFRGWARKTEWFIFFVDLRRVSNDNRDSSKAPAHHGYSVYYVQYMKNKYQHHMCVDSIHCASRHNRITFDTLMIAYGASYTNIPNQNVMQYPSLLCMNIDYVCYQDAWYDHCGSAVCHRLEANSCCCCCCCHSSWGRGKWQYQVYIHIYCIARDARGLWHQNWITQNYYSGIQLENFCIRPAFVLRVCACASQFLQRQGSMSSDQFCGLMENFWQIGEKSLECGMNAAMSF